LIKKVNKLPLLNIH